MFERLQKKWKVSAGRLLLILVTFALGGSATGYLGKRVMSLLGIENPWLFVPIYIIVVTLIWPLMVLIVSIPFGQFNFFRSYITKLFRRMSGGKIPETVPASAQPGRPLNIAIFASGTGSNAQKLLDHFGSHHDPAEKKSQPSATIKLIVSNKSDAGVLNIARHHSIPILLIEKEKFFRGNAYVDELKEHEIDIIILAGFLWKIPQALIAAYPNRIINIHPALLPKYGGKGFYGKFVHEAVIKAGEKESGITIHFVDDQYDHGGHIFQSKVIVSPDDTPESLAKKVQQLEHEHFPRVIEELIKKQNRS